MRNLFERAVAQQANRIAKVEEPSKEVLCALELADLEKAAAQMQAERALSEEEEVSMEDVDATVDDVERRASDDTDGEDTVEAAFR